MRACHFAIHRDSLIAGFCIQPSTLRRRLRHECLSISDRSEGGHASLAPKRSLDRSQVRSKSRNILHFAVIIQKTRYRTLTPLRPKIRSNNIHTHIITFKFAFNKAFAFFNFFGFNKANW